MISKLTKGFFVLAFLVLAGLHALGEIEPSVVGAVTSYLCFAFLAYKVDVKVTTSRR